MLAWSCTVVSEVCGESSHLSIDKRSIDSTIGASAQFCSREKWWFLYPVPKPERQKGTHICLPGTFLVIVSCLIDLSYPFSVTFCRIFACEHDILLTVIIKCAFIYYCLHVIDYNKAAMSGIWYCVVLNKRWLTLLTKTFIIFQEV